MNKPACITQKEEQIDSLIKQRNLTEQVLSIASLELDAMMALYQELQKPSKKSLKGNFPLLIKPGIKSTVIVKPENGRVDSANNLIKEKSKSRPRWKDLLNYMHDNKGDRLDELRKFAQLNNVTFDSIKTMFGYYIKRGYIAKIGDVYKITGRGQEKIDG